ncbi:MAG TPA: NnrS family protein [Anaeromyxobacteraceae bacterium]|nr:NnrS family protein [Anaeromyxobacteraceae bacterium]
MRLERPGPRSQERATWLDVTDPWRVFFPMGVALAWAAVLHWLLFSVGLTGDYRAVFHATVQIQGFMTAIAMGFLYTFVPRRTGTSPPSRAEWLVGAIAPLAVALAAWLERRVVAQALWICAIAALARFVVRRLRSPGAARRVPAVFLWVVAALLAGIVGAVLVATAAILGPQDEPELWQLGRGLLFQGFVSALVVGVGGTLLPTLLRGEPVPAPASPPPGELAAHAIAVLLFLASFPLEIFLAPRFGLALRAAAAGGVLALAAQLWRRPSAPGLHRRLIWLSAWLLPAGYALAAAAPTVRVAALHVVFIGTFALMALSVSLHVALSHGGDPGRLARWPWQTWSMGLLLIASLVFRFMAGIDAAHVASWLGPAAASFLLATVAWGSLVARAILRRPTRG